MKASTFIWLSLLSVLSALPTAAMAPQLRKESRPGAIVPEADRTLDPALQVAPEPNPPAISPETGSKLECANDLLNPRCRMGPEPRPPEKRK